MNPASLMVNVGKDCQSCKGTHRAFLDWYEAQLAAHHRYTFTSNLGWSVLAFQGRQLLYCPFCGKPSPH